VSGETIAITGGTGFVGQTLVRLALEQGYAVRALARKPQKTQSGITWIPGSLNDQDALCALVKGTDGVIHVAGVVNALDRAGFEAGNVAGTLAVIEAARSEGVERFIHVSSLSAREPDLSNYGWSKAKAETLVQASGLDWSIVRPPAIYGPGDKDMLDVYRMAKWGYALMPPKGRVSLLEVSDLGRLLLALIPAESARAAVYEADDGRDGGWTYESYAKAIGWGVGKPITPISVPKPLLALVAHGDRFVRRSRAKLTPDRVSYLCHPDWVIDPTKRPPAEIWVPQVSTRDGLKATAAAYRLAGWL
jgi:nucleoside-diphosphate-sugar epimerase